MVFYRCLNEDWTWDKDILTNLNTSYYKRHCNIDSMTRDKHFTLLYFAISAILAFPLHDYPNDWARLFNDTSWSNFVYTFSSRSNITVQRVIILKIWELNSPLGFIGTFVNGGGVVSIKYIVELCRWLAFTNNNLYFFLQESSSRSLRPSTQRGDVARQL